MTRKIIKIAALATTLLGIASSAQAAFIYNVNRTISNGSVVGTIETDETIGALAHANVLNWNLLISDGSSAFTLNGTTNSELLLIGGAFSATANELSFDFGAGASSFALFQSPIPGSGQNWWCVETASANCAGEGIGETVRITSATQYTAITSAQVIATRNQDVPEPASFALLGLGMIGAGFARRRKTA